MDVLPRPTTTCIRGKDPQHIEYTLGTLLATHLSQDFTQPPGKIILGND